MSGWADTGAQQTRAPKRDLVAEMKAKLYSDPIVLPDFIPNCTMFYGYDNTAKTGLALSILTEKDIKEGKKIIVVDLDMGAMPLIMKYHKDKALSRNIIHIDPMVWSVDSKGNPVVDYEETLNNINAVGVAVKETWKDENVKAVVFDGGSKLLKYSEQQMRVEKALTPDGGVSQRYWIVRNKLFLEALELYKSLPVHKIFIFHEDFIPERQVGEKIAAVKLQTNQMMFEKVFCERIDMGSLVQFRATIHKAKGNIEKEGTSVVFAKVNKDDQKFEWNPEAILKELNFLDDHDKSTDSSRSLEELSDGSFTTWDNDSGSKKPTNV